jgi:N-dimethylarginine dimethylaminohydrolase
MEVTTRHSEVGHLRRVLMKHPREAFVSQASIDAQWAGLNYVAAPDFRRACAEFDAFARLLEDHGTEVDLLPSDPRTGLDSIYTRDASIVCDAGVIVCAMGKPQRSGEPAAQAETLASIGGGLIGKVVSPGTVEGGDVAWLGPRLLAVGQGYRTNAPGISQLRQILGENIDVHVVPLPHWRGTNDVMHLMSLVSPVTSNVAVVYSPLLPVPFRTSMLDLGYRLVEVPDDEFESIGTNVLSIAPAKVVILSGNRRTRAALEAAGVEVLEYDGREISVKGAGGPTCLTRPLLRSQ